MAGLRTFNADCGGSIPSGGTADVVELEPHQTHYLETPFESDVRHQALVAQRESAASTRRRPEVRHLLRAPDARSAMGRLSGFHPGEAGSSPARATIPMSPNRQGPRLLTA